MAEIGEIGSVARGSIRDGHIVDIPSAVCDGSIGGSHGPADHNAGVARCHITDIVLLVAPFRRFQ